MFTVVIAFCFAIIYINWYFIAKLFQAYYS